MIFQALKIFLAQAIAIQHPYWNRVPRICQCLEQSHQLCPHAVGQSEMVNIGVKRQLLPIQGGEKLFYSVAGSIG